MTAGQLLVLLERQMVWSLRTFGPGPKTQARVDHVKKELMEIEENPQDPIERADLLILSMDAMWRTGHSLKRIAHTSFADAWRSVNYLQEIECILNILSPDQTDYVRLGYWECIFHNALNSFREMGYSDDGIFWMVYAKQLINYRRLWPAPVDADVMIEHDRSAE